jgi:hypothetical protein
MINPLLANSAGASEKKIDLAISDQSIFLSKINALCRLTETYEDRLGQSESDVFSIQISNESEIELSSLFDKHGSDKGAHHKYSRVYSRILSTLGHGPVILEIGLGTFDTSVLSNMGSEGKPGASLKALLEYRMVQILIQKYFSIPAIFKLSI